MEFGGCTLEIVGMTPEFWKGKKVFITGHTGFKGSWLVLWLKNLGAIVTGYSLEPPTNPNLFELARVESGINHLYGDIRKLEALDNAIATYRPEIVVHLAAQSLVRVSYEEPVDTYATNVMGTVNVLEAVRRNPGTIKCVLIVTSDKCYQNKEWLRGYKEEDAFGGFDPYSNSKGCAELVTSAYRNSFFNTNNYDEHGVSVASVRAGNVIGGGDWAKDRLFTDVMNGFLQGKAVEIRSPNAIRPWQHVLEPLSGYLALCEHMWREGPAFAEGWNFGPDRESAKPVSWIVEQIGTLLGDEFEWEVDKNPNPHEATYLYLDSTKAKEQLNWSQKLSLEKTLEWIVEWYSEYKSNGDLEKITNQQIVKYQALSEL